MDSRLSQCNAIVGHILFMGVAIWNILSPIQSIILRRKLKVKRRIKDQLGSILFSLVLVFVSFSFLIC